MFRSFGFAFLAVTLFVPVAAHADDWRVVQSSGPIWVQSEGAQPISLRTDAILPSGATLTTGAESRVLLTHGTQTLVVGPNSVITVPSGDSGGITTVLQRAGEVEFDIDRQKSPHFEVETPYLAAIVKGTHFTVGIDNLGATVSVTRGLVEVTDLASGNTVDIPAGQNARATRGPAGTFTVGGPGQHAAFVKGAPRAPSVLPVSPTELVALQTDQNDGAGRSTPDGAPHQNVALTGLAGAGSGGDNGGNSGNSGDGRTGGSVGNSVDGSTADVAGGDTATVAGTETGAGPTGEDQFVQFTAISGLGRRDDENPFTSETIALGAGLSALLAVLFAYLRGRAG